MWRRCVIACALAACGRLEFAHIAPGDGGDARTDDSGDAGQQLRTTYIKASNSNFFHRFGWSVAISTDGATVAVGAPLEDGQSGLTSSGAAYIFVRTGDTWSEQAYLRASNADIDDVFGSVVALSGDGNTLAVGAAGEDSADRFINGNQTDNAAQQAGAVYVFIRIGTVWSQQAYIKAANADVMDLFGTALALSANGDVLAVGAPSEDSAETGTAGTGASNAAMNSGAAYVFTRAGTVWSPAGYLKASNTGVDDQLGFALAMSADGATLVVGAPGEDSGATTIDGPQGDGVDSGGAAYTFVKTATWNQTAYVKPTTIDFGDSFGRALALSGDGQLLVGASPGDDATAPNSGSVFTFRRTGDSWNTAEKLQAFMPGDNDQFGVSVATTTTGADVYMGASNEDSAATGTGGDQTDNSVSDSGATYAYSRPKTGIGWMNGFYRKPSQTGIGDNYGYALAVNGDGHAIAVGIPWEDSAARGIDGDASDNSRDDSGAVEITTY